MTPLPHARTLSSVDTFDDGEGLTMADLRRERREVGSDFERRAAAAGPALTGPGGG